jgi:hypothetical protein
MNRSINILIIFFSFPALAFAIIVGFDVHIDFLGGSGALLPYRDTVFLIEAFILFILMVSRSARRWAGVGMTRKPERFLWCIDMGKERKSRARMYLAIEAFVSIVYAVAFYLITPEAWSFVLLFFLSFIDQLIFMLVAVPFFRVGITHKAVVVADRELKVLYFSGLRRVEAHQQTVYFEYIQDLQLFFPTNSIPEGQYAAFREVLETRVNRDKVFFSDKFKGLK